jgi:hypothetical protein
MSEMCNHAQGTINKLAKQPHMEWIRAAWSTTSATVHMYGVDFMFDSRGDRSELVWCLSRDRAEWLLYLVAIYTYLTTTAASILKQDEPASLVFTHQCRLLLESESSRELARRV